MTQAELIERWRREAKWHRDMAYLAGDGFDDPEHTRHIEAAHILDECADQLDKILTDLSYALSAI